MNFASDNWAGASPRILEALAAGNGGLAPAYGQDDLTREANARLSALFGRDVGVFTAATGTAANSLALAALCPPYGAVYAHEDAHIIADEGGAPEFITQGARLIGIGGLAGKIDPARFETVAGRASGPAGRLPVPAALSLTQATECGTVYRPEEILALTGPARERGLKVHMDGARFPNALAFLKQLSNDIAPADVTWKAGIDALSFGFTKTGALMAEAVVLFDAEKAAEIEWRRKRSGHIVSKARLIAIQIIAMLEDDHWLDLARHANAMAALLDKGLRAAGHEIAFPVEANEVFAVLPKALIERLRQAGGRFYEWPRGSLAPERHPGPDADLVRLVTSFATRPDEVEAFARLAAG
ncbi:threonine aldolase family protein [Labrys monachus]|uniref:Threonine aldolase n=1 Tax=Labrys monachus TaxID=217067 RepID=A0ABU0FNR5_9HYPH|nr:beta-eliminating lyase-related protein [Labrys monachus]MDQ0396106.1 threonine aldolase [Labrys monachus]